MTPAEVSAFKQEALNDLGKNPFRAPLWLRNKHAQTCFPHFFRRDRAPPLSTELVTTPDGDTLSAHHLSGRDDVPRVIVLHGLEGSITSSYITGLLSAFAAERWPVTVMEHRSCDGRMTKNLRLYHSGDTHDLSLIVGQAIAREPSRPLVLCGFSLGANQILKWLGESPEAVPSQVIGAIGVSPPFDLTASVPNLDKALWGAYTRHFLESLIPKALAKAEQFPHLLDPVRIRAARTSVEFDDCASAPLHGFTGATDYWSRVSCGQFLAGIRLPALVIAAADDPFNPGHTLPIEVAESSPWIVPQFTSHGGHVGFVMGTMKQQRYWLEEQIVRFSVLLEARTRLGFRRSA